MALPALFVYQVFKCPASETFCSIYFKVTQRHRINFPRYRITMSRYDLIVANEDCELLKEKSRRRLSSVVGLGTFVIDRAASLCVGGGKACVYIASTHVRTQAGTHTLFIHAGRHARTHATLGGIISTASERVLRGVSSNCAGEHKSGDVRAFAT